jgi:hypothetical protein
MQVIIGEKKTAELESAVSLPYLHPDIICATNMALNTPYRRCSCMPMQKWLTT